LIENPFYSQENQGPFEYYNLGDFSNPRLSISL